MTTQQALDHLILFVPQDPHTNLPKIPSFITNPFTLTPGGFHADGATSNTLILLADGCYIELISFVNPALASEHWWGPDAQFVGWKDWCLTNDVSAEENYERVERSHEEPVKGGRKRADGVDVAWAVTFPKGGQRGRGRVPFFCHDVTARRVRVPLDDAKIGHACGALGVRGLTVIVRDAEMLGETKRVYEDVFGRGEVGGADLVRFRVKRVREVEGVPGDATITLRLPNDDAERERVKESGFWYGDVVLVGKDKGKTSGTRERLDSVEGGIGGLWISYV
ncbi:hypothetical protein BDW02DRAFT_571227 [Decorospora gaudefroyi]|uniref:Glyoxalase-like domain-containing protein n=1 Tax=Decorospora gaudefroyi TaxID=184978 RepID=A0A6A5K3I5_9PLEO|nr:hypothetical protein BDW02DRAFT_571227 [Decorospora gaudefroyi]